MDGESGSLELVEHARLAFYKYRHQKRTDIRLQRILYVLQDFLNDEQYFNVVNCQDYIGKLTEFNNRIIPFEDCIEKFFYSDEVKILYPNLNELAEKALHSPTLLVDHNVDISISDYATFVFKKIALFKELHRVCIKTLNLSPILVERYSKNKVHAPH